MLNITQWFSINYNKSEEFRLIYDELLKSSYLTSKNLEDFDNQNYNLTKLDVFKYITVLEYLAKNREYVLAYILNPYLIDKFDNTRDLIFLKYNEILEVNQYKNVIIDLFFLDIPELAYKSIPLNVLFNQVKDKTEISPYSNELKELNKMGYGFEYFGNKATLLFFPEYYKAFYKNITLYSYKNKYYTLSKILFEYSKDKILEYSNDTRYSTMLSNKIENYSTLMIKWDNIDSKDLNLILNIYKDILEDTLSVKQLYYKCTDSISPLNYQEISNSFLSEYCLTYYFDNNRLGEYQVNEVLEMVLSDLIESNLNSQFLSYFITYYRNNNIE